VKLRGAWIVAGTPVEDVYPCRCLESRGACSAVWCPCSGRLDVETAPAYCCCRVNTPAVAARANAEYQARRTAEDLARQLAARDRVG
jgi:hypothetical protein